MGVGPFPLQQLARAPADAGAQRRAAVHALYALLDGRARTEAAQLLGAEVELRVGAYAALGARELAPSLSPPACALRLEERSTAHAVPLLCELPVELAARLVDRVLGGDGETAHPAGRALDDLSLGALGYLAARICAASSGTLRVAELLDDPARWLASTDPATSPVLCLPCALHVDGRAYGTLRVLVPDASARALANRPTPRGRRARELDPELPLVLHALAARTTLERSQLNGLAPGDIVVPERCALSPAATGLQGTIELRAGGSGRLLATARGRELVIERRDEGQEPEMTEGKRIPTVAMPAAAAPLGDDVPIELCLELARFSLTLGELAALRPGDVLDAGRELGAHVVLTAGGRTVATGELVEVDGDVGMRVLELPRAAAPKER